ncbi:hypothetical protein [Pandoraea anhela]|uniref:Peptidase M15 n=1 Tax=Pandoraea anhela TaxID=2508295 RepID=A0A5E4WE54_9BURK|nr:hypothetical protein [Pandoraea anhela]VVE22898.1 hypothetical protein PAN31108_03225 [Pandoraea anhela]
MNPIKNVADLTEFGRIQLSEHFFMREMLYSEVGNFYAVPNIPDDPALVAEVATQLAVNVLEPLRSAFGHINIRSAYRSSRLNDFCSKRYIEGDKACWCTSNDDNAAQHIWDKRDKAGNIGGTATVVIPGYLEHYRKTADYRPLAWWIVDNIPAFSEIFFFKHLCAFNIRWYSGESNKAIWYLDPPTRELLTRKGMDGFDGDHSTEYAGIIPGRNK